RADDRKRCREAAGMRPRRAADCVSAAQRRRRAARRVQRVAPETHPHVTRCATRLAPGMRHRLEYMAVRTLIGLVRVMPDALVRGCGTLLGLAFYILDRAHRRIAQRNLAVAFPARPASERREI